MRFSRKLAAFSIALVVCGSAACTDLEGTWSLLSFTIYPPGAAPVEVKGRGTLWFDDFGYVMMTLDADSASAVLLAEAGFPVEKNRLFTWGKTIVDKRNRTLKYVTYVWEGQYPTVTARPTAVERLCYWNVTGSTLTLTTKDESGRPLSIGRWRRQVAIDPGRGYLGTSTRNAPASPAGCRQVPIPVVAGRAAAARLTLGATPLPPYDVAGGHPRLQP